MPADLPALRYYPCPSCNPARNREQNPEVLRQHLRSQENFCDLCTDLAGANVVYEKPPTQCPWCRAPQLGMQIRLQDSMNSSPANPVYFPDDIVRYGCGAEYRVSTYNMQYWDNGPCLTVDDDDLQRVAADLAAEAGVSLMAALTDDCVPKLVELIAGARRVQRRPRHDAVGQPLPEMQLQPVAGTAAE